jgi:predicted short-subunit dehydrogenase-like oxidoreductase (DUF2520 family)
LPVHPPVAIAGTGAVAQALGRLMLLRGVPVVALAGRNRVRVERAAAFIGPSVRAVTLLDVPRFASRVLIAVSDDGIGAVAQALADAGMRTGAALHTCGARGPDALAPLRSQGVACGMLHPLQTFPTRERGVASLDGIAFGIAAETSALDWANEIVRVLNGTPLYVPVDRLRCYHAGAVMASNVMVAVLDAATRLLALAGIEPHSALQALAPLARTTLENILRNGPRAALTGPVARGDVGTVGAHLGALAEAPPTVSDLYRAASRHLVEIGRERGLPAETLRALQSVLDRGKVDTVHASDAGSDN